MEQISIEIVLELLKDGKMDLKSTHTRLCFPIINRIYKKMSLLEVAFPSIKVDGNLIIDGHHRYIASILAGKSLDSAPSFKTTATTTYDWADVKLDIDDWDTAAKINMLNERDAIYNSIEVDKISELLK